MTPLTVNPTVRLWRQASTGSIIYVESNIAPDLKVEVINLKDGECISKVDPTIEGSYPFVNDVVGPTPRT